MQLKMCILGTLIQLSSINYLHFYFYLHLIDLMVKHQNDVLCWIEGFGEIFILASPFASLDFSYISTSFNNQPTLYGSSTNI